MSDSFPLKAKIILIAFGLSIGLIAAELVLRYLGRASGASEFQSIAEVEAALLSQDSRDSANPESVSLRSLLSPHPNDKIIFDLRPNIDVKFQYASVQTNSCGMRDVERTIEKPAGTFRIALLGDSFAFGWGVEQHEGFASVLEQALNELSARIYADNENRLVFEVLNFGTPGYSTFQEVALFEDRVIDFSPDAVLVFWVENDFGLPFFVADIANPGGLLSSVSFVNFARRASQGNMRAEQEYEQMLIRGLDPNTALRRLSRVTRELGIPVFFAPNPKQQSHRDMERLSVLRRNPGIITVDWIEQFAELMRRRGITNEELSLSFDPHPSRIKHQLMAELLVPYFMYPFGVSNAD